MFTHFSAEVENFFFLFWPHISPTVSSGPWGCWVEMDAFPLVERSNPSIAALSACEMLREPVRCTRTGNLSAAALTQGPSKQHTCPACRSGCQPVAASVPLSRVTHSCLLSLCLGGCSSYMTGSCLSVLLRTVGIPSASSLSSSVCRAMNWFCRITSGFGGGFFLLLVLALAVCHSPPLLASLLSGSADLRLLGYRLWVQFGSHWNPAVYLHCCLPDAMQPFDCLL